jgi:acyl-[acyl-carrier-protein]-phospholipid O-acyltransferase/long-chain-fatty-acid--[acyl-carrier-protein] ligase
VDALFLYGATDRQVHFVVGHDLLAAGALGRMARRIGVIPFDPNDADSIRAARGAIRQHLADGHVVCLSTELPADREGNRVPDFADYPGLAEGLEVPVVPVHLDHLWGRVYTFQDGAFRAKRPPCIPYPVTVHVGAHLPATVSEADVRDEIARLGVAAYSQRPLPFQLLHRGFIRAARRNLRKMAVADLTSGELNYFKTLVGSIVFARKLHKILDRQPMVGVLVPPSIGGLLTNVALQMMGRVPINLNYTASNEALASCARQCDLTQVITSKKVLERLPIEIPGQAIFLEDIKDTVKGGDRIVGMLLALLAPVRLIERLLGAPKRNADDLATIIFSSGSEGDPKGVMLTHRNLIYDMEASMEVFPHDKETCLVGFLPFFHSFGFMATLWMVLCHGLRGVYHPNPLEPKQIGGLVEKYRGTIMIGTSTFLQSFIRRCTPEQLGSLAFVVCGAEKLSPRVRDAFREKFGVEPLEGYGTTECAPAVSVNIPDLISPGFHYLGTRRGTIGRLIPGQAAKVEDPDTGVELPLGEAGLLHIKGPNIMKGYLHQPEKTAAVLQDGWYATGDIANRDIDGFITITDRLARFSKIAGEMVPHTKVEETLHTLLNLTEQAMAIASVPDTQKGERLVVLHTLTDEQLAELTARLDQTGLPNLWVPRANAFYRIDAIPVLGTGKMDIKSVKQMALALDLGE